MDKVSRRRLIVGASVGVAAVGVGVGVPTIISAKTTKQPAKAVKPGTDPIMVYVVDPSKNMVTMLVGDRLLTFSDPDLVARLNQAAQ